MGCLHQSLSKGSDIYVEEVGEIVEESEMVGDAKKIFLFFLFFRLLMLLWTPETDSMCKTYTNSSKTKIPAQRRLSVCQVSPYPRSCLLSLGKGKINFIQRHVNGCMAHTPGQAPPPGASGPRQNRLHTVLWAFCLTLVFFALWNFLFVCFDFFIPFFPPSVPPSLPSILQKTERKIKKERNWSWVGREVRMIWEELEKEKEYD